MERLSQYTNQIKALCKKHKVASLYAFGSVLTDRFTDKSDIDLVVDFTSIDVELYADNYFDLKFSLEDMLKTPIDLLEEKAIKNPYLRQSIEKSKQLVYGY